MLLLLQSTTDKSKKHYRYARSEASTTPISRKLESPAVAVAAAAGVAAAVASLAAAEVVLAAAAAFAAAVSCS